MTQQLGVVSKNAAVVPVSVVNDFIKSIPYRSYIIHLNEYNGTDVHVDEVRTNLKLSLSYDYETLSAAYDSNTRRNVKKASSAGLSVVGIGSDGISLNKNGLA